MYLLSYLAVTIVAASMLMEDGQGLLFDRTRAFLVAVVAGMASASLPPMIGMAFGSNWTDVAYCVIAVMSAIVIALYWGSDRYVERVCRLRNAEKAAKDAQIQRMRDVDPVVFATRWVPELVDQTAEAVASIARFMERTADTYDDAAIDVRILAGHVPEIVRLAGDAIAKQDEPFRPFTARSAIDRVIAIGRAVEKAAAQLRTPEDEALEARLRYVDVRVEDRFSAIA
jgi:hypothetical protein